MLYISTMLSEWHTFYCMRNITIAFRWRRYRDNNSLVAPLFLDPLMQLKMTHTLFQYHELYLILIVNLLSFFLASRFPLFPISLINFFFKHFFFFRPQLSCLTWSSLSSFGLFKLKTCLVYLVSIWFIEKFLYDKWWVWNFWNHEVFWRSAFLSNNSPCKLLLIFVYSRVL